MFIVFFRSMGRDKRNEKYGYGGQKKRSKSNDKASYGKGVTEYKVKQKKVCLFVNGEIA